MGLAMENGKLGSLVLVQKKNGTLISSFASETAVKLLGRENGSVECFNLEKSNHVEAFRYVEPDSFIRNAESSQTRCSSKNAKYANQEDAISHALSVEKQEWEKGPKRSGNVKQGALYQAKRSRCVYFPVESDKYVCAKEEHSYKSSLPGETASSESTVSDSSESSFEDSDGDGDSRHTGSYTNGMQTKSKNAQKKQSICNSSKYSLDNKLAGGVEAQNWNLKEKSYMRNSSGISDSVTNGESSILSKKQACNTQDLLILDADCQEGYRHGFDTKSYEQLALKVNRLSSSPSGENYSESLRFAPVCTNHLNGMEGMLVDVDLTVQANYQKGQVPLVSLMSKLNNAAIIGHPIEVEVLDNIPEVSIVKDTSHHMVDNGGSKIHQLVWRTAKRTPVCYVSNPKSSETDEKGKPASKTFDYSDPEAKKNGANQAEDFLLKPLTKNNSLLQQTTCVPVDLIFTKLFSAVGA